MIAVVTERFVACPACRKPLWKGRRRFGPARVTCAHCGMEIETGLRDWNAMSPARKGWHIFLEWFFPAYVRGYGFPERLLLYLAFWFLVAIPVMPVMMTVLAFQDPGTLIPAAIFLCLTLAHLVWLTRRIRECRPADQRSPAQGRAESTRATSPREEKREQETYQHVTRCLKKLSTSSGVMGAMSAGAKLSKLLQEPGYWSAMVRALKDEDVATRRAAATAVGGIGNRELVLAPLIEALGDADPQTRAHAASSLGDVADPRAREPLRALAADADASVREQAEEALKRIEAAATARAG